MPQTIEEVLSKASFYSDEQVYALLRLPATATIVAAGIIAEVADPFCSLIVDKDEISIIMPEVLLVEFETRLKHIPQHKISPVKYRLITVDLELEPDLVGFMAKLAQALAAAQVSILPLAAFSRDHLLVPATQHQSALEALNTLKASVL